MTIRRLAEEIEFSQPVIYSHFDSRDAIVAAVALDGFRELAVSIRRASRRPPPRRIEDAAAAYLAFAGDHPAVYEAMFTMPTCLRFAEDDSRPELKDAFASLAAVVTPLSTDGKVVTETFWATLHGLAHLERSGRIRHSARKDRMALVVAGFLRC